jgi:hypothetical protein
LLKLNHERYEEEQALTPNPSPKAGRGEKKAKKAKSTDGQMGLL